MSLFNMTEHLTDINDQSEYCVSFITKSSNCKYADLTWINKMKQTGQNNIVKFKTCFDH